ncbi:hypothetical protein JW905_00325, partial [bacterium]|nr:hypothetical protein [candidate division CSSED10-310 bacterium]
MRIAAGICVLLAIAALEPSHARGDWEFLDGPYGAYIMSLVMDQADPQSMLAGTNAGIFKTTDGGQSWTPARSGLVVRLIRAIDPDPFTPGTIYVAGEASVVDEPVSGGICKSTDSGQTWTCIGPFDVRCLGVLASRIQPDVVTACTDDGLYRSTDGGATWSFQVVDMAVKGLTYDPAQPAVLYGGVSDYGVVKSADDGVSWELIQTTFCTITDMAVRTEGVQSAVYATSITSGSTGGLYRSLDGGHAWEHLRTCRCNQVDTPAGDPDRLWIGTIAETGLDEAELFTSTDGGGTWSLVMVPNAPCRIGAVNALVTDPGDSACVYAGFDDAGLWKQNGGWEPLLHGLSDIQISELAVDPADPAHLMAATFDCRMWDTFDEGAQWQLFVMQPQWGWYNPESIAFNRMDPDFVIMGGEGIYYSLDGGDTWEQADLDPLASIEDIEISRADPSIIWCCGGANTTWGVGKSTDSGETWTRLVEGLFCTGAASRPDDPDILYVTVPGTMSEGGIIATTDGGALWAPQTSGVTGDLWSVWFADAAHGWAVGEGGTVQVTTD